MAWASMCCASTKASRMHGKPAPALMRDALARGRFRTPLAVGDRLDTDIAGAVQPGILGRGWSHLYNARLAFSQSGDISVILGAEQAHFFRKQTGGTFTPEDSRVQAALAKNLDNSYTYTATSGLRYGFTDSGRLLTLTDANDSVLTLGYDAGGALAAQRFHLGRCQRAAFHQMAVGIDRAHGVERQIAIGDAGQLVAGQPGGHRRRRAGGDAQALCRRARTAALSPAARLSPRCRCGRARAGRRRLILARLPNRLPIRSP